MRILSIFVVTVLMAACSGSGSSNGSSGSSNNANVGDKAPLAAVTCADVCSNVAKCGVASNVCNGVCPALSLACQGCLAKIPTCGNDCNAVCGDISNPKSAKHQPSPAMGAMCDAVTFDFADKKPDPNSAADEGQSCTVPWDCRSQACVSGKIGSDLVSFCAGETPCNEPDANGDAYKCPSNWACAEVPSASDSVTSRWTCLPPAAVPCQQNQLQY